MPAEYIAIRNNIQRRCENGEAPGKKPGESCLKYAKRLASIIYYKRTGKTPTEVDSEIELLESVERLLGLGHEHS